jgi:hypothetical protein
MPHEVENSCPRHQRDARLHHALDLCLIYRQVASHLSIDLQSASRVDRALEDIGYPAADYSRAHT